MGEASEDREASACTLMASPHCSRLASTVSQVSCLLQEGGCVTLSPPPHLMFPEAKINLTVRFDFFPCRESGALPLFYSSCAASLSQ